MVLMSDPLPNPLLRFSFDSDATLAYDSVTGGSGDWIGGRPPTFVTQHGRSGVHIEDQCTMRLPAPVELPGEWTLSVWTLFPEVAVSGGYQVLVDGEHPESKILLAIQSKMMGWYVNSNWRDVEIGTSWNKLERDAVGFDALADGWHHLAAVGKGSQVSYYVDARCVGHVPCERGLLNGTINFVGNRAGAVAREPFSYMPDLRLYGAAADDDAIDQLFSESRA